MFNLALEKLQSTQSKKQGILFFLVFIFIYLLIDYNNMSYSEMASNYGTWLVFVNVSLNLLMSFLSALLLMFSTANAQLKGKESMSSNLSFVSVLFGILTYGCTPCVIAFFGSIGIAFSVIALPLAGLPYKFMSLFLLMIGLVWTYYELQHGKCKVRR